MGARIFRHAEPQQSRLVPDLNRLHERACRELAISHGAGARSLNASPFGISQTGVKEPFARLRQLENETTCFQTSFGRGRNRDLGPDLKHTWPSLGIVQNSRRRQEQQHCEAPSAVPRRLHMVDQQSPQRALRTDGQW